MRSTLAYIVWNLLRPVGGVKLLEGAARVDVATEQILSIDESLARGGEGALEATIVIPAARGVTALRHLSRAVALETEISQVYRASAMQFQARGLTALTVGDRADRFTKTWLRLNARRLGISGRYRLDASRVRPGWGNRGAELDVLIDESIGFELKLNPTSLRPGQHEMLRELFSDVDWRYIMSEGYDDLGWSYFRH